MTKSEKSKNLDAKSKKAAGNDGADDSSKGSKKVEASHADLLERYRRVAEKLPSEDMLPFRADARVAFTNVNIGLAAAFGEPGAPERQERVTAVSKALPQIRVKRVLALADLARALLVAADKVVPPAKTGEIEEKLKAVRALRQPMLATAEVLAERGLFPAAVVAKIRSGAGKYDMASDGAALSRLYAEHADAIRGSHPFKAEEIEALRTASEWLLERLTPAGARRPPLAKEGGPEELRDRIWTLLVKRHSDLRLIGYYLFRENFDERTPKLQSRVMGQRRKETQETQTAEKPAEGGEESALTEGSSGESVTGG